MGNSNNNIVNICKVLSVIDDNYGLRIKVRIPYIDDPDTKVSDLPYVFPLMTKFVHVNPKINEMVYVLFQSLGEGKGNRFFFGPSISQPQMMGEDLYDSTAQSVLRGFMTAKPLPNPNLNPKNKGTLPDREDIALLGRSNTDLILKPSEVRVRCGFKKDPNGTVDNRLVFNDEDLGYIQMKYQKMKDNKNNDFSSIINIVADRINILSHDSRTFFNMRDPDSLINSETLKEIFDSAHPLPYGDELINWLKQLVQVIRNHTHPFSMDPPCMTEEENNILSKDLDEMLSNSIRIN